MKKQGIDLSLIISLDEHPNTNMVYFTGYKGLGILAVLQKKVFLVVPQMEYEKAKLTGLTVYKSEKKRHMLQVLQDHIKSVKKTGIEEDRCTVALYKKIKKALKGRYTDVSGVCSQIRMVKEKEELDKIRKACAVTDDVFEMIHTNFVFKTEKQLKDFIREEFQKRGCGLAFPPVVASARGSSQPHYDLERPIEEGFLLLDFGAKYKGYCADMTRMLYVGSPSKEEQEDYDLVLETIQTVELAAVQQETYAALYDTCMDVLEDKADYMTHALGHGLGLDIHEPPALFSEDEHTIQDDIAFTIEPGMYFEGKYGIRIEDTVVRKDGKLEVLTKSPKELISV